MRTGFQRDISRCAARQLPRLCKRVHFGVGRACLHVESLPDNLRAAHDNAAYARIGAG